MTSRRGVIVWCSLLVLLVLGALPGCSLSADPPDDPPPPRTTPLSPAEMEAACHDWSDVACRKNQECASIEGTLDACIARETASCLTEMQGQSVSCQIANAGAIDRCDDELEALSCSKYCGDSGSCFFYCPYFC